MDISLEKALATFFASLSMLINTADKLLIEILEQEKANR